MVTYTKVKSEQQAEQLANNRTYTCDSRQTEKPGNSVTITFSDGENKNSDTLTKIDQVLTDDGYEKTY